jgi:uncharacterized protein YndB with AHSA1/START domain
MKGVIDMMEVKASVVINQPIEKVFEFVTKPENDIKWWVGGRSWDHTPDEPSGVGSTSQSKMRFMGIGVEVTWEVVGWDPPNKIEVKTIEGPVDIGASYTLEAAEEGQTKLTVEGEGDLHGVFDLAEPLVERSAQRQWANNLENLKDLLEA